MRNDPAASEELDRLLNKALGGSLHAGLTRMFSPPGGWETWADYEKYGDAFTDVRVPKQEVETCERSRHTW